jgi:hypothetical protein
MDFFEYFGFFKILDFFQIFFFWKLWKFWIVILEYLDEWLLLLYLLENANKHLFAVVTLSWFRISVYYEGMGNFQPICKKHIHNSWSPWKKQKNKIENPS